jgi:hypothetical protein
MVEVSMVEVSMVEVSAVVEAAVALVLGNQGCSLARVDRRRKCLRECERRRCRSLPEGYVLER